MYLGWFGVFSLTWFNHPFNWLQTFVLWYQCLDIFVITQIRGVYRRYSLLCEENSKILPQHAARSTLSMPRPPDRWQQLLARRIRVVRAQDLDLSPGHSLVWGSLGSVTGKLPKEVKGHHRRESYSIILLAWFRYSGSTTYILTLSCTNQNTLLLVFFLRTCPPWEFFISMTTQNVVVRIIYTQTVATGIATFHPLSLSVVGCVLLKTWYRLALTRNSPEIPLLPW